MAKHHPLTADSVAFTLDMDDYKMIDELNAKYFNLKNGEESSDDERSYSKEDTQGWKDPEEGGRLHRPRREPRRKGAPYTSVRDGKGNGHLLTPTEYTIFKQMVVGAQYSMDMIPEVACINWWRITFEPDRRQMRQYLQDAKLRDFNPKTSRLAMKAQQVLKDKKAAILAMNPLYFSNMITRQWNIRTMIIAFQQAIRNNEFYDDKWEKEVVRLARELKEKRAKEKKDRNQPRKSQLNGANGEATGKDDTEISENTFNQFLGQFNTAVKEVKKVIFTDTIVEGAIDRRLKLCKFEAEINSIMLDILLAFKYQRWFVCTIGNHMWRYEVQLSTYTVDSPTTISFSNLHRVVSSLNGAQGEVTGSDDYLDPCPANPCALPHFHRKKGKPKLEGAARRLSEKETLCKPVKIEDLVRCTETICDIKEHYHITKADRTKHAAVLDKMSPIERSLLDDVEKMQGIADGQKEYEEVEGESKATLVMKWREVLQAMARLRYPPDSFPAFCTIVNEIVHPDNDWEWIHDVTQAREVLDMINEYIVLYGVCDQDGFSRACYVPESTDFITQGHPEPVQHVVIKTPGTFDLHHYIPPIVKHEACINTSKLLAITRSEMNKIGAKTLALQAEEDRKNLINKSQVDVTQPGTQLPHTEGNLNNVPEKSEVLTLVKEESGVAPENEISTVGVLAGRGEVTNVPSLRAEPIITVGGWSQTKVNNKTIYNYVGDIDPHESFGTLKLVEVTYANRQYRNFQWCRELPRRFNGWWTGLAEEKPYYFGRSGKQMYPVILPLLETLSKTRLATTYTDAALNSTFYQGLMAEQYPSDLAYPTILYFIEIWTLKRAQINSLHSNITRYLIAQNVPMRVPLALGPTSDLEGVRSQPLPAGLYHNSTTSPIHLPHIVSAYFGSSDDPIMVPNKRWKLRKVHGGATFINGYVKFPTDWCKETYESVFCAFAVQTGVIQPCRSEIEKILLRLTMDKTGRDSDMIRLQQLAFNEGGARLWLASMSDQAVYPLEEGWITIFTQVYRKLLSHPIYGDSDWKAEILEYIEEIGIKVKQRIAVVDMLVDDPHVVTKAYNEVAFKPDENQKIKYRNGEPIVSYARAFISLPGQQWATSQPHHICRFKSLLSHTIIWDQHGMMSEDGFVDTPSPHDPWMHTTCLYPTYVDPNGTQRVKVDGQHLALVIAMSMMYVTMTKGFASVCHGDDVWTCRYHPEFRIVFVESDIVSNDISHTQFAFAQTALAVQAAGLYSPTVFKQMQRDVRLFNGDKRKEYVQLEPALGFNLPTGSVLTTPHNSYIAMLICYAMLVYGCDDAQNHIGYTLEMKTKYRLSQSTFLAHFFYLSPDGAESGPFQVSCSICPSVLFRGAFKTRGDFLGKKGVPVTVKGYDHVCSVVKGMLVEDANPIRDAFRSLLPTSWLVAHPDTPRTAEAVMMYRQALVERCERDSITDQSITAVCDRIRGLKYGSVIADPVVDALLLVRYGIPPSSV
jgi:hypothetical protein